MKRLTAILLLALNIDPSIAHGEESIQDQIFPGTYQYKIIKGKGVDVCDHMVKVYNQHFRTYWSTKDLTPEARNLVSHGVSNDIEMGLSPTSPEFDAVPWKIMKWPASDSTLPINSRYQYGLYLVANFDINNDGVDDVVIPYPLYDPKNGAVLQIFNAEHFVYPTPDNSFETLSYRSRSLTPSIVNRPFIWQGTSYVHQLYGHDDLNYPQNKYPYSWGAPMMGIYILKVMDSGLDIQGDYPKNQQGPFARTTEICDIKMTDISLKNNK